MSIAKRNSRLISVDGQDYRWSCSFGSGITNVVVQIGTGRGQKCVVQIDGAKLAHSFESSSGYPKVAPSLVAKMIRDAIVQNWSPESTTGEVRFHLLSDGSLKRI